MKVLRSRWVALAWLVACGSDSSAAVDTQAHTSKTDAAVSKATDAGHAGSVDQLAAASGGSSTGGPSGGAQAGAADSGAADRDAGGEPAAAVAPLPASNNPPSCPATYAALLAVSTCASTSACAYPEGYCSCVGRCSGAAPDPTLPTPESLWSCKAPGPGCPAAVPTPGAACEGTGMTCIYGSCCISIVTCRTGQWSVGPLMCPP